MSGPLHVRGVVLPDGEHRDLYVRDGVVTYDPVPDATALGGGGQRTWIVPGLVDAHCHVGLDANGAVDEATQLTQACTDRNIGALLLRDCGSAADTRWIDDRDDLPEIIRAGRHIARSRRYIRNYAAEVEPDELPSEVAAQAARGDGWVKIVGDWIDREAGDLTPSFPGPDAQAAVAAAHAAGARITAHVFGEAALPALLDAGIDCVEHGTGLTADLIEQMAAQGTALVPTAKQLGNFPRYADQGSARFPAYATHMRQLFARRRETVSAAYEAGVAIYAGTDAGGVLPHGLIADEVIELASYGIPAADALGAASWRARAWLGRPDTLAEGVPASFVVYPADPLADLEVLRAPLHVVLRGVVVA